MMASEDLDRLRENLRELRLNHMAEHLDDHLREAKRLKLGHVGFMARVTDGEVLARGERGTRQRISRACFEEVVSLDEFVFKKQPTIDRRQIMDLAELGFVDRCESVLFMGPSGVGKSHLATALGVGACESGYRASELFPILHTAMADESLDELLEALGKPHVLIIDELGAASRKADQDFGALFYELVGARHRRGSFIVASNFAPTEWAKKLGNEPLVTAAVDRLLDGAHVISVPKDAPSFRAKRKRGAGRLPRRRLPASVRRYRRR
jgi:DNA replication protein DnaC